MAAKVHPGDREKTKQKTGDTSFPMQTGAQIASAIYERNHGKKKSAEEVLDEAEAAVTDLLHNGKIDGHEAAMLRNKIKMARQADRSK
jgi:hypothetical protein